MASTNIVALIDARRDDEEDAYSGVAYEEMVGDLLFDVTFSTRDREQLSFDRSTHGIWRNFLALPPQREAFVATSRAHRDRGVRAFSVPGRNSSSQGCGYAEVGKRPRASLLYVEVSPLAFASIRNR
jgi:hypothetical protein